MESAIIPGQNYSKSMAVAKSQEHSGSPDSRGTVFGVCVMLVVAVFLVFSQTLRCEFVFDDAAYVYKNPAVTGGLSLKGVEWAFTHNVLFNWHPLTVMSHMLDCQLYGLNAGGHHLTNVLLHAATVILLFLVLHQITGALWRSALVAAVFAIHPLRVESVAWVAERKDVLSGLFLMLTLWAYGRYVEQSKVQSPKSKVFYGLTLGFFALGLLSKPMVVTLPFVLLLLDYWPLNRFASPAPAITKHGGSLQNYSIPWRLLLEKIPLLVLSSAFCVVTMVTQKEIIEPAPVALRMGNAVVSYVIYLRQMICPAGLAVLYPYPRNGLPGWEIALAVVLLAAISAAVFLRRQRQPYLLVGWLWYLGMLVPAIGLVQSGLRAHADRYTYLPQIGLYLAIVWTARDLTISWRNGCQILGAGALSVIVALMVCTWKQTSYWRTDEILWKRALACTSGNYVAHNNLGYDLAHQDRPAEAIEQYQKALEINPDFTEAHNNLGTALLNQGWLEEASEHYHQALDKDPAFAEAHNNLGILLTKQDRIAEAIEEYRKAIELNPNCAEFCNNLGNLLAKQNQTEEAIEQFQKALEVAPDNAKVRINLANTLTAQGRWDEAIEQYQQALNLTPDSVHAHNQLGLLLQTRGEFKAAIAQFQKVLELDPRHVTAHNNLAWLLATCPESSSRDGKKAVELAQQAVQLSGGNSPEILDTLAAAYAEAGQFPKAIETARRALDLSVAQNHKPLAEVIQNQLRLFEANSPYHEKP
jgi:tetratricopeptide (TPR) repeat protein